MRIEPVKELSGEEVKEIRRTDNLTQRTLAEFLGVSAKAVEAWEAAGVFQAVRLAGSSP